MDSVAVTVPLRPPTKKMKKRKELDALAPSHVISRRSSGKRSSQELLTDSSDERSEYWNLTTRVNRKCRGRRGRACPGLLKACGAFFACASILATASLIWLFSDVRQQLTAFRTEVDQVRAGSEAVPDALQKCHSLSRDLQNNQTTIFNQLSELKSQLNNFTVQLSGIQQGLHQVQESLQGAPELTDVPQNIKTLFNNTASFGSQIRDLEETVNTLKKANTKLQDGQTSVQQNITVIQRSLLDLSNVTLIPQSPTNESRIKVEALSNTISQLASNFTRVNETLSRNITWIAEDQAKDHTMLVTLQDTMQNASGKVMTLQEQCTKASDHAILVGTVKKLTDQMNEAHATDKNVIQQLELLKKSYNDLKNSATAIQASIIDLKNQQEAKKKDDTWLNTQKLLSRDTEISTNVPSEHDSTESDDSPTVQRKLFPKNKKKRNVQPSTIIERIE